MAKEKGKKPGTRNKSTGMRGKGQRDKSLYTTPLEKQSCVTAILEHYKLHPELDMKDICLIYEITYTTLWNWLVQQKRVAEYTKIKQAHTESGALHEHGKRATQLNYSETAKSGIILKVLDGWRDDGTGMGFEKAIEAFAPVDTHTVYDWLKEFPNYAHAMRGIRFYKHETRHGMTPIDFTQKDVEGFERARPEDFPRMFLMIDLWKELQEATRHEKRNGQRNETEVFLTESECLALANLSRSSFNALTKGGIFQALFLAANGERDKKMFEFSKKNRASLSMKSALALEQHLTPGTVISTSKKTVKSYDKHGNEAGSTEESTEKVQLVPDLRAIQYAHKLLGEAPREEMTVNGQVIHYGELLNSDVKRLDQESKGELQLLEERKSAVRKDELEDLIEDAQEEEDY